MKRHGIDYVPVIKRFLPPMAELLKLQSGHPAVITADLDGDGSLEVAAAYKYQGENYVLILKRYDNTWHLIATIKGKGYNITNFLAAPVTTSNANNLIIGWQVGGIWSELDILQWNANGLHAIQSKLYFSKMEVEDMPGEHGRDGKYELVLWTHDMGEAYKIEVYKWRNGLIPAQGLYPYYFKKVIPYYERLVQHMPESSVYWYYLADAHAKARMPEKALQSINKALQLPYPYPSKEALLQFKQELQTYHTRQMMYYNGFSGYILAFKQGDVNGDRILDSVYIVGDKPFGMESTFAKNITLVVLDGKTNQYKRIPLKENMGYNPTVYLGDFTGDKINDIFVRIDSDGSGGYIFSYIYSFIGNSSKELFNFEIFNKNYQYDVAYKDGYKADVISKNLNKKYTIDLAYKEPEYLSEIYDENGRLKKPLTGEVSGLVGLYPVDFNRDGIDELQVFQRIVGRFNADTLGFIETSLKWDSQQFVPIRQYVATPGQEIIIPRTSI
jgi:tetratricopeptide (TPR) repeat protein